MLLAVDIGNTNIVLGVFDNDNLLCNLRITTKVSRTSDEYGILIRDVIMCQNIDVSKIDKVIISNVVPSIIHSFASGIIKYFKVKPLIINNKTKTGITLNVPNPKEIGVDRIVDCASAYAMYKSPVIVCDFGTATTYDLVSDKGEFICGVTSIGIKSAQIAMHTMTAQLPDFPISKPDSILATDTISSLQAGLVYGVIGQTEYIVNKLKDESGLKNIKVIATGGLGRLVYNETNIIEEYNKDLTLLGLNYISKLNG